LSLEDERLSRAAMERGDRKFVVELAKPGPRGIRAELKVRLAAAAAGGAPVNTRKFAAEMGCDPRSVRDLRNSLGFRKELGEFIVEHVLAGEHGLYLQQTLRQLGRAIMRGEPWAIKESLKLHGLIGAAGKKQDGGGGFEDGIVEQEQGGEG